MTAIHAAKQGDIETLKALVENGNDLSSRNEFEVKSQQNFFKKLCCFKLSTKKKSFY